MDELMEILNELRPDVDFENETALITDGILDSFDIVALVGELNDAFDIEIKPNNLVPDNFNSAKAMMALIDMDSITFDDKGKMILSDFFRNNDRRCLNLYGKTITIHLEKEMLPYIQWHNEHTFIRTSRGVQIVAQEDE